MSKEIYNTPRSLNTGSNASSAALSRRSATPLTFLVAEDDEFTAQLIERLVVGQGHHTQIVKSGDETLRMAVDGVADLVLLDIHLPVLDGFQIARRLREHERFNGGHLPLIALTASSTKEDREQCLAAGMDDFVTKPIQVADLWNAVRRAIGLFSRLGPCNSDLIDVPVLLAASGNREENLKEMCRQFLAGLPGYLSDVDEAYRKQDAAQLRRSAHKLCGMISACSTRASGIASEIEDLATRGKLVEIRPLMEQLNETCRELLEKVSRLSIATLRGEGAAAEAS